MKTVTRFRVSQDTRSFPDGAPQRESYGSDKSYFFAEAKYGQEWCDEYRCEGCGDWGCPKCGSKSTK